MKKLIFLLTSILIISVALFAQDSTGTDPGGVSGLPSWVYVAAAVIVGIWEVVVRLIPTAANLSIIGVVISLLQKILPNKSTTGEKLP